MRTGIFRVLDEAHTTQDFFPLLENDFRQAKFAYSQREAYVLKQREEQWAKYIDCERDDYTRAIMVYAKHVQEAVGGQYPDVLVIEILSFTFRNYSLEKVVENVDIENYGLRQRQ